ncbi:MAG TPA: M23 family metallopeptidase [Candidatus Limnocylindrales bacterium]|nr:M23 family metallopeptidase [Candidatus Limnocylindrales bacterium]
MLNAPAGALRAIARLRPSTSERSTRATRFHRRSIGVARGLGARLSIVAHVAHLAPRSSRRPLPVALRRTLIVRLASERMIAIVAALVVLGASVVSLQPAAARPIGDTTGAGTDVRIAIGGESTDVDQLDPMEVAGLFGAGVRTGPAGEQSVVGPEESYADDGTVYKPVAVNTTVRDGKGLLQTYTVRSGDTLTGIASHFGVSMMTVWWANKLSSKDDLHVGQKLVIPPVDGLVVTVKDGDTLDALAAAHKVDAADVVTVNELDDPTLIIGQTLILPGAVGAPIPTPTPTKRPATTGGGGGSCNCSGPSTYNGGAFSWPVVGGGNYISQYFRYGHYAIDIAADYGSRVRAAAAGRVIFAGWKSNGGGYQVWISHGSGLYTTYNHMASVGVSTGTSVGKGQAIGRVGQSGRATGPHLHFEVWVGSIWNGGYRVNPLKYY